MGFEPNVRYERIAPWNIEYSMPWNGCDGGKPSGNNINYYYDTGAKYEFIQCEVACESEDRGSIIQNGLMFATPH